MNLKIVSFNVKCAWYGKTLDGVAELLREIDGDLVGLQELDVNTKRSNKHAPVVNQLEYIAQKAGYPYWSFARVLDFQGGYYGHGVLSKYPILNSTVIWPKAQPDPDSPGRKEMRNIERHEIDCNGKLVTFYNTHLSNGRLTPLQYGEVQNNYMIHEQYPIFVGDMNAHPHHFEGHLDTENFITLNGGADLKTPIKTSGGGNPIDHIILSRKTMEYELGDTETGLHVVPHGGTSDHNLIYALVNLK